MVSGYPLPTGGKLNNVHLEVHIQGPQQSDVLDMFHYGFSGFVVPVPDPDAAVTYDNLWDTLIPKDMDAGSGVLDLDTEAADTTPEFELGELDLAAVFEISGLSPKEIFRRRKMISASSQSIGYTVVDAAPDTFTPMDHFTTQVRKQVRVNTPSGVMFAVSSPDTAQTDQVIPTTPSEKQWFMLQYMDQAIENMLMFVAGLIETGAESPYEDASLFIASLLENNVYEGTAGSFASAAWNVVTKSTYDITVPGRMQLNTLSSE